LKFGHLECQGRNGMMLEQEFVTSTYRNVCQILCHKATKNRQIMTNFDNSMKTSNISRQLR